METEMKYSVPSREAADDIWDDFFLSPLSDNSTAEKVVMKAVYFDTEDMTFLKNDVTFRVRSEGDRSFATMKWGGKVSDGLHERGELNVPVHGEEIFIDPPIGIFSESDEGKKLAELAAGKSLINLLETRFLRRRIKLHYLDSIIELAIDTGSVITDAGSSPILELELELYHGPVGDLLSLGEAISEKYGLAPENISKFARGLHLLGLEESKR